MPSHLRLQSSLEEPIAANAVYHTISSPNTRPSKRQRMSLSATYQIASTARAKLGREASRADHNLHRLVGHANLLDNLMVELQDAEREQEAWFSHSVRTASKPEQPRHVQWIDTIAEEEDAESDDSDSEDDTDELFNIPLRKIMSPPVTIESSADLLEDEDMDAEYESDEEEDEEYALRRVVSNKNSPPELLEDSDSESEDEEMLASPENVTLKLSEKERQAITTTALYDIKSSQGLEDYIMQQPQQPLVAAC